MSELLPHRHTLELKDSGKTIVLETSWDDGVADDMRIATLLHTFNLPGTFYIPTATRGLTDPEVQELARSFAIGGHTETHRVLRLLPVWEEREEIANCKEELEQLIQKPVRSFCYPKGKYNGRTIQLVQEAGYTDARTVDIGECTMRIADPYRRATTIHVLDKRREYAGSGWERAAYEAVEKVFDPHSDADYFHIWGHSWEVEQYQQWSSLRAFFQYLRALIVTNTL